MHYLEIKELAGRFRRNPTVSEKELWNYLKGRQLFGRKFLRQHPIIYQVNKNQCFFFIPDFYCHQEKLVIELDGGIHDERIDKDEHRNLILENLGLTVIHIRNELMSEPRLVLQIIAQHFKTPTHVK